MAKLLESEIFMVAADRMDQLGKEFSEGSSISSHTDHLFVQKVISTPAAALRARAEVLRDKGGSSPQLDRDMARIRALFDVNISFFERKKYRHLSHQPNKAMNLNSYISLIGSSFFEKSFDDGTFDLLACSPDHANFRVPAAKFWFNGPCSLTFSFFQSPISFPVATPTHSSAFSIWCSTSMD